MKENKHAPRYRSLLFVCYGNTCRSPMAEGLAKKILGSKVRIESAGIYPVFKGAAEPAVKVMRELYKVDISLHVPRHIDDVFPERFERIIVLDAVVHEFLKKRNMIPAEKLALRPVVDPFGRDRETYRRSAQEIHHIIENLGG